MSDTPTTRAPEFVYGSAAPEPPPSSSMGVGKAWAVALLAAYVFLGLALVHVAKSALDVHSTQKKHVFGADDRIEPWQIGTGWNTISHAPPPLVVPGETIDADSNVIHTGDGRRLTADEWRQRSRKSIVALFTREVLGLDAAFSMANMTWADDFRPRMEKLKTLGQKMPSLCKWERFIDQPVGPFCSGTLIGRDLVLTAGHCVMNEQACSQAAFVFGFMLAENASSARDIAPFSGAGDVYLCKRLIHHALESGGRDYAVVQLDRHASDDKIVVPKASANWPLPWIHTPLVTIGHGMGLPSKVDAGGRIERLYHGFFTNTLDVFPGNSGSGVFDAATGLLLGVTVRGDSRRFVERAYSELDPLTNQMRRATCLGFMGGDEKPARGGDAWVPGAVIKSQATYASHVPDVTMFLGD